jgi:hypothetical protein
MAAEVPLAAAAVSESTLERALPELCLEPDQPTLTMVNQQQGQALATSGQNLMAHGCCEQPFLQFN